MHTTVERHTAAELGSMPRAAWRLIVLEFWERFSYYGILAILVLFLTGERSTGGFGWSDSRALNTLSVFAALAFMLPTVGGYIADRFTGARRAVLLGSILLVVGNVLLTLSAAGSLTGTDFGTDTAGAEALMLAGLGAVALGNCFFKSPMVTLIGNLFDRDASRRDQAFRYYYQAIMLGTLASALFVGSLVKIAGWWSGFALTAVGMTIALLLFLGTRTVDTPARESDSSVASSSLRPQGRALGKPLLQVIVLGGFLSIIMVGWVQFQGLWILEVERWCDRAIGPWSVPSSWLLAVNAIGVVLMAPSIGRLWRRLGDPEKPLGFGTQFAAAFFIIGVGHLLMALGFRDPQPHSVSMLWPIASLLIVTVADALFWPSSYNAIHNLSPTGAKSLLMGVWFAMFGIGQYFTHQIARLAEPLGFSTLSVYIGLGMFSAGLLMMYVRRRMSFPADI